MFREKASSALAGSPSTLLELEFGVFWGGRKCGEPREKPSEEGKN